MSPEAYNAEILRTLKSLEERVGRIEAAIARAPRAAGGGNAAQCEPADDRELDSKYGNPTVRKDPKRWLDDGGESYAGMPFSHCPPDYLETLASFLEWRASKEEAEGKDKYAGYSRSDAARARGWARRIRQNGGPAVAPPADDAPAGDDPADDSDIPF